MADTTAPKRKILRRLIAIADIFYLAVMLVLWVVVGFAADKWWMATLIVFGVQWLWAVPLVVLVPITIIWRPRLLKALIAAALILVFPVMGFNIPLPQTNAHKADLPALKIITCNVHREELDTTALKNLITQEAPDVVALQEFDYGSRSRVFGKTGWTVLIDGELVIASRWPMEKLKDILPPIEEPGIGHAAAYSVNIKGKRVNIINLHLATPHPSFNAIVQNHPTADRQIEQNSAVRYAQAKAVSQYALSCVAPVIIAGDFNTPVNSNVYRQAYAPFVNAWGTVGWGFGHTYFFGRLAQVRIDHILASPQWRCQKASIAASVGSKHLPVVAQLY